MVMLPAGPVTLILPRPVRSIVPPAASTARASNRAIGLRHRSGTPILRFADAAGNLARDLSRHPATGHQVRPTGTESLALPFVRGQPAVESLACDTAPLRLKLGPQHAGRRTLLAMRSQEFTHPEPAWVNSVIRRDFGRIPVQVPVDNTPEPAQHAGQQRVIPRLDALQPTR
jgi:hypothetical protein